MATQTKHAPGTFCWPELHTTDTAGAKKFYSALFGWTGADTPMGEHGTYTIFKNNGRDSAALTPMMPDQQKQGMPPHWSAYIAVADADASAKKAAQLGGKVLMEPFDVMETLGRMAVIQDPQGAIFCVWQAKDHAGVGVLGEPNALVWTELLTTDTAKAEAFYTQLIGWTADKMPMENFTYTIFKKKGDDRGVGGMMQITDQMKGVPPNWLSYFHVTDIRRTVDQAKSLGATIQVPATTIPNVGDFSIVRDPQGATFALLQPAPNMG